MYCELAREFRQRGDPLAAVLRDLQAEPVPPQQYVAGCLHGLHIQSYATPLTTTTAK